jgi:oligopeptidase B
VRVIEPATGNSHRLQFPEPVYSVLPENNPEFDAALFRYQYESFITARSVFDYDLDRREAKLLKQQEVPGGYDPKLYRCERHYAPAADGKRIPVSLVYRKDLRRAGPQPLLLTGYGAYGAPATVWFNSAQLSLLDRGVIFALAHIRGGGDLGKPWHDDGRMLKKRNTFTDFIAASEFLVAQGFTAPDRLAIEGGSAGGLLIGAVVNMRPELFRAAHLGVPFVDVINTMLDESLPLTVTEFEEWGNPKIKVQYDYIRTYSPYDNLRRGEYPALLVTTSFNDSQVMYWEPAKYVAKLRTLKTDKHVLLLKTVMAGGHGGPSGRYDSLKERAVHDAFFLNELGIHE